MTALPTRKDEAWRYADLAAVERLWPLPAAEQVSIAAVESLSRTIIVTTDGVTQLSLTLEAGAVARLDVLNMAPGYGRIELDVTLHEGADFTLGGAQIGAGDATLEIITTVTHAEPGATSRQLVRSVLGGHSTGTYLGKVAVARGAQQTDSEQSVKAMLLDRTATANAKPELEIYADDVKCAHGCAIGELDAMGLFYLQSRGLTPADAKRLMLHAFVAEVFDGASEEERLVEAALARLGAVL
ncbi:SufD family Fe-S cluster assembly protein [Sphingomonas lacunae]|uniref:SufD family Fe-S cluster assembly protein n=1 Tax=Sphingomonas lacunae TaxID=2698828 RepID=A0A6M4ASS2_9SPHN|nr:SufD family Fe-S cluster assembly protein [Sphingomonas lacunae]QJQ31470.1 SufD family Fe-S cluster assembly protein [Sphingomonas lacunae]